VQPNLAPIFLPSHIAEEPRSKSDCCIAVG
jgi:hypothetical protein